MPQPGEAGYMFDSGWVGPAPVSITSTVDTSTVSYLSVYVMTSGAAAPSAGKVVDPMAAQNTICALTMPTAAGTGSVTQIGPGITGTTVANQISFVNAMIPIATSFQLTTGAGSSWSRMIVIGR